MLQGTDRLIPEEPATPIERWHRFRGAIFLFVLTMGFFAVVMRLAYLQCVASAQYRELATRQQTAFRTMPARRGTVYAAELRPLAVSQPVESVFAVPVEMKDRALTAVRLAKVLRLNAGELRKQFDERPDSEFVWVKRRVSDQEYAAVDALQLEGVHFRMEFARRYPQGHLAPQVLGWTDVDDSGREGIELLFDKELTGRDGYEKTICDSRRRAIATDQAVFRAVEHGCSVVLTLDVDIQRIVEEELDAVVKEHNPVSVTAIVMDPHTGRILACGNRPTYDPTRPGDFPPEARQNRAVIASYEPGSIFKPFVMSALFELKLGTPTERIFCENGLWRIRARRLRDHSPYAWLTLAEVIQKSSNVGMAKVGMTLGEEQLYRAVKAYGFSQKTGVQMPGEVSGYVTPFDSWSYYTVTSVPMGQEITATPLQLLNAFNVFANGGWLLKPQAVEAVLDADGKVKWRLQAPERVRRVISEETASEMVDPVLRNVIVSGTGKSANIGVYDKFGKTGTGQKAQPGGYSHTRFVSSFLCGAPVEDPKLTVLVLVNEPRNGASLYGGTVAAPTAARIIERALSLLGVPPSPTSSKDTL